MGHTILLQWTFTAPSRAPLTDIILTRVLEHYQLQYSSRLTIQFRTFRAKAKTLTVVQYIPQTRAESSQQARDDVAYLVLDDRSASSSSKTKANGEERDGKEKEKDKAEAPGPIVVDDDDEIQVIEPDTIRGQGTQANGDETSARPGKRKPFRQYRTLAVRPAGAVVPMLHNLLSPFVLGVTKSARQAASTTAQQAPPTSLPGTQVVVQSYTFPTLTTPNPPITLTVHSMPPNTNSIILEAEYVGSGSTGHGAGQEDDETMWEAILKEFLEGCIPDNAGGERRWAVSPKDEDPTVSWEGSERIRRTAQMMTTTMREASIV